MKRSQQCVCPRVPFFAFVLFLISSLVVPLTFAASPTTTQLTIAPATSVPAGTVLTFTATVTSSGTPLTSGLVLFCDMETATYCEDSGILGKVWLTHTGTATLMTTLSYGGHNIQAVFQDTNAFAASASDVQTVSVLGGALPTTTTLSSVQYYGYGGLNQAQVTVRGAPIPLLSGSVSFLDATNGNYPLTTLSLTAPTVGYTALTSVGGVAVQKPEYTVVGDFNGDGYLDFVIASNYANTVQVYLGAGNGTFTLKSTYTSSYPAGLSVADFNGDGHLDFAVMNSNTISIFRGNGDGTFTLLAPTATSNYPYNFAVADLNGDGIPDIAYTNNYTNKAYLLLGVGDGTFVAGNSYATGNYPEGIVAADFNRDGFTDLAVVNEMDNTVTVLLGDGTGAITTAPLLTLPATPYTLVAADFNSDGITDLAVSAIIQGAEIYLGNGDGTFGLKSTLTNGSSGNGYGMAVADLNANGKTDLIVGKALFINDGFGNFTVMGYSGGSGAAISVGDFNSDGSPDLLTPVYATSSPYSGTANIALEQSTFTKLVSSIKMLGPGSHNVYASYSGDGGHAASQSSTAAMTGAQISTATTLSVSPSTSVPFGTNVQFTATVSPNMIGNYAVSGTVTFKDGTTVLGTGTIASGMAAMTIDTLSAGTHTITATYGGDTNFLTSSKSVVVIVTGGQVTPTITWPTPASIVYGTALSSTQLNATSGGVDGTFVYTPPSGTVLNAGTQTLSTTFTPTDTVTYTTATATVQLSVQKATPTVTTWPTASAITYGQTLGSSVLTGGTASVPGTFAFTSMGITPPGGTSAQSITFTPSDSANYTAVSGTVNVTVNPASQAITITVPAPSTAVYNTQFTVAATASSGLALAYSSTGGCTNVGATFTMTSGTTACSVRFDQAGDANYQSAAQVVQTVVASKATPTVTTWPTASAITYGQSLSVSILSGGSASVSGTFAFTNPGTVPPVGTSAQGVTFTPTATADYNPVAGSVNLTVTRASQTITITVPAPASSGYNTQFTVAATATSALAVTYNSAGGCTNSGATFTMTSGTMACTVKFDQAGDANYQPATQVVQTVSATKATPTVTTWPTASAITYGQSLASSVLSGGSASVPGAFVFTNSGTTPAVGSSAQSVTFTPTDTADYDTVVGTVNVTVNPASQTITVTTPAPSTAAYGTQFTVAATASSGLAVTYSSTGGCTNIGATFTMTSGATSCSVKFDQAGNSNYTAATQVIQTVTASKATPTVTTWPTASAIVYGQSLMYSSLSGGSASVSGTFAFTTPGTVPSGGTSPQSVTFTPTDNTNYNPVVGSVNVTVNKAGQTITVTTPAPGSAVYGAQFTVAATANSGLTVTYSSAGGCTNSGATFTMTSSTTACSVRFDQAGNTNYSAAPQIVQTVTASKATPTVTAWPTASSISYGQSLAASTLSGGSASAAGIFAFTTPGTVPPVGTNTQSVTFTPTDLTNYNTVVGSVSVTVNKASQTITVTTAPPASAAYNSQFTVAATASSGLAVTYSAAGGCSNSGATFTMTSGTTACSVQFDQAGNSNYAAAPQVVRTVNATKLTPTVTAWPTASAITYGSSLSSSTLTGGTASVAGSFAFTNPATVPNAGTAAQSVTFTPTLNTNYNTVTGTVNVTVSKKALTVTANGASRLYGAANPTFTATYTGFVNGDTVAVLTGSPNLTTTATTTSNAGTYTITAAVGTLSSSNYSFTFVNGTLTVVPAPLTITANDRTKTFGQTLTMGTTLFTATGLLNGQTVGAVTLTSTGSVNTATVAGSPYPVVPSNARNGTFRAANYSITYVNGSLVVSKATSTTKVTNPGTVKAGTAFIVPYTVTAQYTGTATGTVTVTATNSGGTAVATCSSALTTGAGSCSMTIFTTGTYTLTGVYSGDTNFLTSTGTATHVTN